MCATPSLERCVEVLEVLEVSEPIRHRRSGQSTGFRQDIRSMGRTKAIRPRCDTTAGFLVTHRAARTLASSALIAKRCSGCYCGTLSTDLCHVMESRPQDSMWGLCYAPHYSHYSPSLGSMSFRLSSSIDPSSLCRDSLPSADIFAFRAPLLQRPSPTNCFDLLQQ